MKNLSKLAALALVTAAALSTNASAQSFGMSWGNGHSNHGYYHHTSNYHEPVVYRHVAQAPVYYVQPQVAYYARPVYQPVVSHRYVKRQTVQTYYEAVPRVRNQFVGYEYYSR